LVTAASNHVISTGVDISPWKTRSATTCGGPATRWETAGGDYGRQAGLSSRQESRNLGPHPVRGCPVEPGATIRNPQGGGSICRIELDRARERNRFRSNPDFAAGIYSVACYPKSLRLFEIML
jgi:hypothetical protein